jgi:hypothetical protein
MKKPENRNRKTLPRCGGRASLEIQVGAAGFEPSLHPCLPTRSAYRDAAHMKKDTDLDPLREREDFKKLIAELEKRAAAEKQVENEKPAEEKKP